jgi:hypothetical protein
VESQEWGFTVCPPKKTEKQQQQQQQKKEKRKGKKKKEKKKKKKIGGAATRREKRTQNPEGDLSVDWMEPTKEGRRRCAHGVAEECFDNNAESITTAVHNGRNLLLL